jgi:hypothetical protein
MPCFTLLLVLKQAITDHRGRILRSESEELECTFGSRLIYRLCQRPVSTGLALRHASIWRSRRARSRGVRFASLRARMSSCGS